MSSWSFSGGMDSLTDRSYSASTVGAGGGTDRISGFTFLSYVAPVTTVSLYLLAHSAGGLEMYHERLLALDAAVGHLAHLLRIELLPLVGVELLVELQDVQRRHKVDEGVAHVALVLSAEEFTLTLKSIGR